MTAPLVSIITPAHNAERFIGETIRSVQAQTMGDWEMLVADDASPDGTRALVEQMAREDPRIRLVALSQNGGPARARNAALAQARGRYVAFLDSDDLWLPAKLERQLAFMREGDYAVSYTAFRRISVDGGRTGRLIQVPKSLSYRQLLKNTAIATLTCVADRQTTGPFEMTDAGYDDYILWLELLRRGFVAHGLQEDLARYRVVGGSISSKPQRSAAWTWNIYRNIEGLDLVSAAWCMGHYGLRAIAKRLRF